MISYVPPTFSQKRVKFGGVSKLWFGIWWWEMDLFDRSELLAAMKMNKMWKLMQIINEYENGFA